jgi:hypothetical protein
MHHKQKFARAHKKCASNYMEKKTASANARITDQLRARLDAIHERHLTNDATVITKCLEAFCAYVEKNGKVEFPVEMVAQTKPDSARRAI